MTDLWQTVAVTRPGVGAVAVQSPAWADGPLTARIGLNEANRLMLRLTERAAMHLDETMERPPKERTTHLLTLLTESVEPGHAVSTAFALNSLVALDLCFWTESALAGWDSTQSFLRPAGVMPPPAREPSATIPMIGYHSHDAEILTPLEAGCPLLKIKIGNVPADSADPDAMVRADAERVAHIHHLAREFETLGSDDGRVHYYLDANGRYPSSTYVDRLCELLDAHGSLERVLLLEEPLPVDDDTPVDRWGLLVAADESVSSAADLERRHRAGYSVLALKPIAKTFSLADDLTAQATELGMHTFVADLTANPWLDLWNVTVAAQLPSLPGMRIRVSESNGAAYYRHWAAMVDDCRTATADGDFFASGATYAHRQLTRHDHDRKGDPQ